jgi:hypothetical protein
MTRLKSDSLAACKRWSHKRIAHSPNGVDMIEECPNCCIAWIIKPSGEEIRLYGSYEERLVKQSIERR